MELPSAPNEAVSTNVLIKEGEGERVQGQPSQEEDEDEDNKIQTLKLISPHVKLSAGPEWIGAQNRLLSLVQGDYEYYHYKQDGYEDSGWGCCYRGIQMIVSWFTRMDSAHYKNRVPTIRRIQQLLQEKDPAHIDLQVGSKTWIGSVEGGYILNWYLGVECDTLHITADDDLANYSEVLTDHFQTYKCPVLVGVGEYAYVIVGICTDANGREDMTGYLVVDPHYEGIDDLKIIISKKWICWKKADFFKSIAKGKFINICIPTTKQM
eukprot:GHVQ01040689.1.p1 GENE.GHVQ01040689.1~~GHVQ01040689.1.p1  ORF type:complete len:266 (+),score=39.46 GHVQ01040689.1:125-922(+)